MAIRLLLIQMERRPDGTIWYMLFQWDLPVKSTLKWKIDLNYNRLSIGRDIYTQTEKGSMDQCLTMRNLPFHFLPQLIALD